MNECEFEPILLSDAIGYLTLTHEQMAGLCQSPNPIIRAIARENMPKIETVVQWLDTRDGICPVSQIFAVLGKVSIYERYNAQKGRFIRQIFPPLSE